MKSDRHVPVAIVGGGFSGTMLAAQLSRRGVTCILIEGEDRAGRGVAFSTIESAHLLNVRAEEMSAWPDEPNDFAREVESEGIHPRDFAERRMFGRYLRGILHAAVTSGHVEIVQAKAITGEPQAGGWLLTLDDGSTVTADGVALANGNQSPEPLDVATAAGDRFINNPWDAQANTSVQSLAESGGEVLLLGTGLTMVDMVLSLSAAGHRGRIVALSRRGLIPRGHSGFTPSPVDRVAVPHGNVRALWRWLRHRSGKVGWRAAVDALRPHSHALWQALDGEQQQRFLRHARPWWDVHRHRIAPEVARQIADKVAEGRLEIVAGRIAEIRVEGEMLVATIDRRRTGKTEERRFAYAFNCTGPLGVIGRTRDPLLRGLLDDGLVKPDQLGIGLQVDEHSRADGADRLWALGPLTKGRYWEIVAVPDIREQAAAVADDIAAELSQ